MKNDESGLARKKQLPLRYVMMVFATLSLFALIMVVYHQRRELVEAQGAVDQFEIEEFVHGESSELQSLQCIACRGPLAKKGHYPNLFGKEERKVAQDFTHKMRENILLPALKESLQRDGTGLKSLYLMGLVYATHDNELGGLVRESLDLWAQQCELPPKLLSTYLDLAANPWEEQLSGETLARITEPLPEDRVGGWEDFFEELQVLNQKSVISQEVLRSVQIGAERLLEASTRFEKDELTDEILGALEAIPQSNVHQIFDEHLGVLAWVDSNRGEVTGLLSLVKATQVQRFPIAQMDFASLADELEEMLGTGTERDPSQTYSIAVKERLETYRSRDWEDTVSNSRVQWLLDEFLADKTEGRPDLLFPQDVELAAITWRGDCDGCPLFLGEASIDGRYSRKAGEAYVAPVVSRLVTLLDKLTLEGSSQPRLQEFLDASVDSYALEYRDAYRNFYAAFGTQADTLNRLKVLLLQVQNLEDTPLDNMLTVLAVNTDFSEFEDPSLRPLQDRMREFAFANRVGRQDNGQYTGLLPYIEIIADLEADLLGRTPMLSVTSKDPLEELLSPIGQLSYKVLTEDAGSYWTRVSSWLDRNDVPEYYREPFLKPLHHLLDIGFEDVSDSLMTVWEEHLLPIAAPLFRKYPFDPEAHAEVSAQEISGILGPASRFWREVESYTTPFCAAQGKCADSLAVKGHSLNLPPQMACVLQGLATIRDTMWETDGTPRPFTLAVKPIAVEPETRTALGYLDTGSEAVYSFAQTPDWQQINVEWWKNQGATIGVTLVNRESTQKSNRRLDMPRSIWSFLRLMQKASTNGEGVWSWELPAQIENENTSEKLPFELKGNMIDLFDLKCLQG